MGKIYKNVKYIKGKYLVTVDNLCCSSEMTLKGKDNSGN